MKTIQIKIPDGKKAEWVNGVLTLVEDKPVEFKFELNDIVKPKRRYRKFSIYRREVVDGEPRYWLTDENGYPYPNCAESLLEPYTEPQDTTKIIKTFDDAYEWCKNNGKYDLIEQYQDAINVGLQRSPDIFAYLQLRIIACALNGGWFPTFDGNEMRYVPHFDYDGVVDAVCAGVYGNSADKLVLKSKALAKYAGTQFKDIYKDFCGGKWKKQEHQ